MIGFMAIGRRRRRRRSRSKVWWRQQYGGMPVWGLGLALVVLIAAMAIAVPAALTPPQRSEAAPRPLPSMFVPEKKPVAAFIGDSYTAGDGLPDKTTQRWSHLVADALGWSERNFGYGGTGYTTGGTIEGGVPYSERIDRVAASNPDIVIVAGGRNDLPQRFAQDVPAFFDALKARLPDATIVAIEPQFDAREYPADLTVLSQIVEESVESVGGTYVTTGHVLAGRSDMILPDGVHPDAQGHAAIAEATLTALEVALPEDSPSSR